ncbi:MAG: porin family protein [Bacteroidales bacterium]|jgi:hypothetical protein|nr:porin family protein [Bacteroidales bacterium]MDD3010463.1 porin family protein [Bacteroidales bacterium]MDD3960696.1 porin family protein [Bacteroidales bacterium]MDY0287024.1 porin family protein [Bacteroidales bacterium]HPE86010.1 porin family protein [Bacteroidales bacterium]
MKKILPLFIFFIVFYTYSVFSQQFNGGFVGGISASEVSGDYLSGPNKLGAYAGVFANIYIAERSSFQMEIDYVQKGSRKVPDASDTIPGLVYDYKLVLNYINIPLLYKYDWTNYLSFEAGPSVGLLLDSYEMSNGYINDEVYGGKFNFFDFGLDFGLSLRFLLNWELNVRYSNTVFLTPVRPHAGNAQTFLNRGQLNEVLSFTLHYTFFARGRRWFE